MKWFWVSGLAAALLGSGMSPAFAEDGDAEDAAIPLAPLSNEQEEKWLSYYLTETIAYRTYEGGLVGRPELLRRAVLMQEPQTIWKADDAPIVQRINSAEQPREFTNLLLTIGVNGAVTHCAFNGKRKSSPALAEEICPIVAERMRFTPALGLDGNPAQDAYSFQLSFTHRRIRNFPNTPASRRPNLFEDQGLNPAPASFPNPLRAEDWPIIERSYRPFAYPPTRKKVSAAPYTARSADELIAGVAYGHKRDEKPDCHVMMPSGNATFDASACVFLMEKYAPEFREAQQWMRSVPYLVVGKNKPQRVFFGDNDLAKRASLIVETGTEAANSLVELAQSTGGDVQSMSFLLSHDSNGVPNDCRIRTSSGDDATDFMACAIVRDTLRYTPAIDIFGREAQTRWQYWKPSLR